MAAVGDSGYFATAGPGASIPGSNQLYSFNLFTGDHTLIGSFVGTITGTGIGGLAVIPEPMTIALVMTILLGAVGIGRPIAVGRVPLTQLGHRRAVVGLSSRDCLTHFSTILGEYY